jgi:uncharacterized OsmC-like protein
MVTLTAHQLNGINLDDLKELKNRIAENPGQGFITFQVKTAWKDGLRSESEVDTCDFDGKTLSRGYVFSHDEPTELMGANTSANPQELLMAAFNACVIATFVSACSLNNVSLEKLEIETHGRLNLRGFLGLDKSISPGYDEIQYTLRIKGSGTKKQFQKIHDIVKATSPNFWNLAHEIKVKGEMILE